MIVRLWFPHPYGLHYANNDRTTYSVRLRQRVGLVIEQISLSQPAVSEKTTNSISPACLAHILRGCRSTVVETPDSRHRRPHQLARPATQIQPLKHHVFCLFIPIGTFKSDSECKNKIQWSACTKEVRYHTKKPVDRWNWKTLPLFPSEI